MVGGSILGYEVRGEGKPDMNCRPRSSAVLGRMGSRVATAALLAGLGLASAVASPKAGAASPNAGAASPNTISVPCDGAAGGLAGLQAAILVPHGQISAAKLAQSAGHIPRCQQHRRDVVAHQRTRLLDQLLSR